MPKFVSVEAVAGASLFTIMCTNVSTVDFVETDCTSSVGVECVDVSVVFTAVDVCETTGTTCGVWRMGCFSWDYVWLKGRFRIVIVVGLCVVVG